MRRWAKKPPILKLQKEVALLIDKNLNRIEYKRHQLGCYWHGRYAFEDKIIYIYWQNYVGGRMQLRGCNYINIHYENPYRHIYKKELLRIKSILS